MIFRFHTFAAIVTVCLSAVHASSVLGVRNPYGIPTRSNSGMSLAMGGTGVGVAEDQHLMLRNPANLGAVHKTVLASLFSLDFALLDQNDMSSRHADFIPHQISLGFPIGKFGTIGASFEKRGEAELVYQSDTLFTPSEPPFDPISSQQDFIRTGGLTVWQAGWGYAIGPWANVGLSYERLYLRIDRSNRLPLGGESNNLYVDTTVVDFGGNGVRLGVLVPVWDLNLGVAFEYLFPGEARYTNEQLINGTVTTSRHETFELQLPPSLDLGASWRISQSWLVAADADFTFWSVFDSDGHLPSADLRSTAFAFSLGGEYVPAPDVLTARYWETIAYRAGFRVSQLPATSAYEWALSLGAGLPLPSGGGLIDLDFQYGQRLDADYPDISEQFIRLGLGINGGRKWRNSTQKTY